MAVLFRLGFGLLLCPAADIADKAAAGFGLLLCPAADIADKAAAVDIAEAEAVIVDVHLSTIVT